MSTERPKRDQDPRGHATASPATPNGLPQFYDEVREARRPEHPIDPLFISRWSPRAMTGRKIPRGEWLSLMEAARWAPSSFNSQFWRFIVCERDHSRWQDFLDLLVEGNRDWAERAALLVLVACRTTHERNGKPARTAEFDTGAAWQNMALEGARRGLVVHAMEGFDHDRSVQVAGLPSEGFKPLAMVAIGERADPGMLSDKQRSREKPSGRKGVSEFVFLGRYGRSVPI